ncbi:unnamed protein product [Paramecium sonneborni]|uniref:PSI domain-containing protein n=2 Tax=Paramecium sonneborni TaxID=65129 RepID=A0A8S1LK69_9CILI|nr:unnamed protein product [Paramecium sonneborni]
MIKILICLFVLIQILCQDGDGMDEAKKLYQELHGEIELEENSNENEQEQEDKECEATKQDEQIYMAKQLSKVVLEEQIEKITKRLSDINVQIESLKYNMPTNEKSDECIEFKDCAACTKNAKCGWCSMEEKCVAGDNIAPFYTMCNFYNYLYCAGECARYVDCDSCVKDTACGWCEDQPHIIISCVQLDSDGIQCPQNYLIGDGADKCPKRQLIVLKTVNNKKRKETKAEEPNNKNSERGWEDNYVFVRQGRYKERMNALRENASPSGASVGTNELDRLYDERATLEKKLNSYQKQYKKLVGEGGEDGQDENADE